MKGATILIILLFKDRARGALPLKIGRCTYEMLRLETLLNNIPDLRENFEGKSVL